MTESTGTSATDSGHYDNVACPFCGILCDDLAISRTAGGLKVTKNGCDKAKAGFERAVASTGPQIAGKPATLSEAVAAAAKLVKSAELPIFGGLGTDVEGMRAVMSIADNAGGVVDHALSEGQYRNFRVLQSGGWVMTTLTEARNRADLFVIVGSDIHQLHPRFFERIVCNEHSMFSDNPPKRTVVFLGEGLDQSAAKGTRIG
ncbi:MAG: formylmethanofuran dehydrogenase, partial [Hyphomicrobium sp.]